MVVVVRAEDAEAVATTLEAAGETVFRIGGIVAGQRGCTVSGSIETWSAREDWQAGHDA